MGRLARLPPSKPPAVLVLGQRRMAAALLKTDVLEGVAVVFIEFFAPVRLQPCLASQGYLRVGNEAALAPRVRRLAMEELPTFLLPFAVFAFAYVPVRPFFAGQEFPCAALPGDPLEAILAVVVVGAFALGEIQPCLASQ
eukprot:CAMPEP_0181510700 /NCGR_PEP_ID=MMETSP1110-20121109/61026_1 /TAXON_ID=174948 /ORGANISM="Symbiodinium sp., Strain CCMP421" /LENGTH=139 /DNA_ID=CAMNT_0023640359 /DNA_START=9 /DNA_END=428 /DNA_ORIENTATION=-